MDMLGVLRKYLNCDVMALFQVLRAALAARESEVRPSLTALIQARILRSRNAPPRECHY